MNWDVRPARNQKLFCAEALAVALKSPLPTIDCLRKLAAVEWTPIRAGCVYSDPCLDVIYSRGVASGGVAGGNFRTYEGGHAPRRNPKNEFSRAEKPFSRADPESKTCCVPSSFASGTLAT